MITYYKGRFGAGFLKWHGTGLLLDEKYTEHSLVSHGGYDYLDVKESTELGASG